MSQQPKQAGRERQAVRLLPFFDECEMAVKAKKATPLQQFIYDNEPAGDISTQYFRATLIDMLEAETFSKWKG